MAKLQKPIPKKMGNKPKLDNPIKQKKQQKKEKSAFTKKAKLLDDSTPVKEAKVSLKPGKDVNPKKQHNKALNGEKKTSKKPLNLIPESPEQKQNGKGKKSHVGKEKNVATNGVKAAPKSTAVPEKVNKKLLVVQKSVKPAQDIKAKSDSVPVKIAPSIPAKAVPKKANKKLAAKSVKPAQEVRAKKDSVPVKVDQATASQSKGKAHPLASLPKANVVPAPSQSTAPQKKAIAAVQPKAATAQKKPESAAPQKKDVGIPANPGKKLKNKNKKKAASGPEVEPTPKIEKIKKIRKPKEALQDKKKAKIAFRKQKLAAKDEPQKEKKSKAETKFRFDPIPYDEDQFKAIVNSENIKKIAEALKKIVEKEMKTKKSSIFDDYRYFLQVANFKIPSCPKRMVRLHLKHSLADKDDDVLLVVADLQRGSKVDYEPTKHHYEDLLRQNGVEGITVMPMNQLKQEYSTFDQRRRLGATYEHYLCEGRIMSHVGKLIGNLGQKTRNTFHPVNLSEDKDIKAEIERSLKKTAMRQLTKCSLQSIPVGTHKFTAEQLADNIELIVAQLKKVYPGGLGNIRNLHLKIGLTGTSSLPLYMSMAQAPEETPMVLGPREERMIKLKREANEVLSKFSMTKEGKLIKLTKSGVEKKRKVLEMKAALKADEGEKPGKKAKKAKKDSAEDGKKKKKVEKSKELDLPEEDDDDEEEDVIQLGQGSDDDDETEDDEMANLDEEDTESGAEIVENGFVGEDDEESEEDDEQEVNQSDEDDDDEDEDDDDEDEDEDEEESD